MKQRCPWAGDDPLCIAYHDDEWGVPSHDDRHLLEMLNLEGAQAGLSWITILRKRDNYRRAFADWDATKIARFGEKDFARLMADAGIVRNRLKIRATIGNARAFLEVRSEFWQFRPVPLAVRWWDANSKPAPGDARCARQYPRVRRHEPRFEAPRVPFRRFDHLPCLHASGRHGERSHRFLFPS